MTFLSVVAPIFNEGPVVREFVKQVTKVLTSQALDYEVILVDDGSTDDSWKYIESAANENKKIVALKLSKNFDYIIPQVSGW